MSVFDKEIIFSCGEPWSVGGFDVVDSSEGWADFSAGDDPSWEANAVIVHKGDACTDSMNEAGFVDCSDHLFLLGYTIYGEYLACRRI